jgi:hypothetical protein
MMRAKEEAMPDADADVFPLTEEAQRDADRALVRRIYDHARLGGDVHTVECIAAAFALLGVDVKMRLTNRKTGKARYRG